MMIVASKKQPRGGRLCSEHSGMFQQDFVRAYTVAVYLKAKAINPNSDFSARESLSKLQLLTQRIIATFKVHGYDM